MPKRVLGNDPFERGAAQRPVPAVPKTAAPPAVEPRPKPPPPPKPARASTPRAAPPKRAAAPRPVERPPEAPAAPEATSPSWVTTAGVELNSALSVLRGAAEAVRAGLGSPVDVQLDVYGGDAKLQAALAPLADFLYTRWFRVSVEGAEHIPRGGALLVANHAGALPIDGPVLNEVLRRTRPDLPGPRWLVEDQVFYAPVLGTLLNRLGAVRASRKMPPGSSPRGARCASSPKAFKASASPSVSGTGSSASGAAAS